VEVVHDLCEEDKKCACGTALTKIGEEVSEKLDIIPAKVQVLKHIRYKYACKNCEGTESEEEGGAVKTAPMPPQIIPQGIVTPGLLSFVLTSKFCDALPFYRQEKIFERIGAEISRATMCNWAMLAAERMDRLLELLWENIAKSPHLGVDETTVQVLQEPGRKNTTKSYMWVFRGGTRDHPVIIFRYSPTRSSEVIKKNLKNYKGYLQSDGYTGYDVFGRRDGIIHAGCWAHVRRKFVEAAKITKEGLAHSVIDLIRKLYKVEEKAREDNLSPEETLLLRQKDSLHVMESIKKVLDREVHHVAPKSPLGKAIRYTLDDWKKLVVYLLNGIVPIDTTLVETAIRPFVVGRKNWLFSGSPRGAEASAAIYSIIETAKANGLEPYAYLRHLFEKLPLAKSDDEIRCLLPNHTDNVELS
jgi:transposase